MGAVLDLHVATPVPRTASVAAPAGLELAGATVLLNADRGATGGWRARLSARTERGWGLVGELDTRATLVRAESAVVLATAGVPGAIAWQLEGWPLTPDPTGTASARMTLAAGSYPAGQGLHVDGRWAERVGERRRLYAAALAAGVTPVIVPAGSLLQSWSSWMTAVGGVTIAGSGLPTANIAVPTGGSAGGEPGIPGPLTITFTLAAGNGGYQLEVWE